MIEGLGLAFVRLLVAPKSSKVCFWVDPETKLPIYVEGEFGLGRCVVTGFTPMTMSEVDDHFEWDVDIDESKFLPDAPEGFQKMEWPPKTDD